MLMVSLDNAQATPLVEQIVDAVRSQIDDRILRAGMKMPPIRKLAESQQVSRFTVVEAYDRLVALGYLRSRRGSGFYVAPRREGGEGRQLASVDRAVDVAWMMRQALDGGAAQIKASAGWLPPDWLDEEGLRRHLRSLSRRPDARLTAYGTAHGNLRLQGATLVGVPRKLDGPDVEQLEALLAHHKPRVFFTHSVLHNPTGANLSPGVAFRILQLAEKHDFLVIEDDTYADFHPHATTRLANLDQLNRVIFVGSFSKTLSGSLRVGYLAARPDLAAELTDVKTLTSVASSEFNEQLVYQMLTDGHYRKYLDRLQGRLAQATDDCLRMLERVGLEVYLEPKGGVFLWARPPGFEDVAALASAAAAQNIMLAPGKVFRPQMQPSPWLRFNVAFATVPAVERFLGETLATT